MEFAGWLVMTGESCERTKRKGNANINRNVEDVNHGTVTWLSNGKIFDDVKEFWIPEKQGIS
jgi:hypothetical protein